MAKRKMIIPEYGTVIKKGVLYYRTRIKDADGKLVALYARTPEELYNKETIALEQIENATFHRKTPTVAEYCEKWLLMQSVHVRTTTLTDYTSKVRRHIIAELGDKRMGEVSLDDIQLALVSVSKKSASVYKSVVILYKSIFRAAKESRIIDNNPTIYLTTKGGGVPQKDKAALTDEQVERLLDAVEGLPTYVFVMLGLYAGLRREEILALKWDSVYLDGNFPYLTVRRAWHTENNRPVILEELKLNHSFGETIVAKDIDFQCHQGEVIALIGPNGTGKSTIGRILAGLLKEKSGEVVLFGKHCRPKGRLGKVWYIPQDLDSQLFGEDLLDELTTGAEVSPERKQAAEEILEALELTPFIKQHPSTLSGGQKQRLALGVALMHEAPIIILDEPTSGLDGTNMRNVSRVIRKLAKMGRTIIVITHDAECALACCERAIRLENGYITDDFQINGAELLLEKIGYDQKEG